MAGKGKQTSAERRKERQAAARAAAVKRARKVRLQAAAGVVALALVGGGVAGGVAFFRNDDKTTPTPPQNLSLSPAPTPNQSGAPAGKANCNYVAEPPPPSVAPASVNPKNPTFPPTVAEATNPFYATFDTSQGEMILELDSKKAPCAVNSFVSLANQHFYDNTICHRLVDSVQTGATYGTLQCGDPTGTGTGGPGYKFANENTDGAVYSQGVVAMANSGPDINGSQFFMMYRNSDFGADYTPFAHILTGMDVLYKVAAGGTTMNAQGNAQDAPNIKLTIKTVTISNTPPKGVSPVEPTSYPTPKPTPTATPAATGKAAKNSTPTPTATPTSTP